MPTAPVSDEIITQQMLSNIKKQAMNMSINQLRSNIINRKFIMTVIDNNISKKIDILDSTKTKKIKEYTYLLSLYNIDFKNVYLQTDYVFENIIYDDERRLTEEEVDGYAANLLNISTIIAGVIEIDESLKVSNIIEYEDTIEYDLARMYNIKLHKIPNITRLDETLYYN